MSHLHPEKINRIGRLTSGNSINIEVSGWRFFSAGPSDFCQNITSLSPIANGGITPTIVSTSVNDASGGAGWDSVRFFGWDVNGDWITAGVLVTLNGITPVAFPTAMSSILWPATVPSIIGVTNSNFGDITIDDGTGNSIAGADQTSNCIQAATFKVPPGHKAVVRYAKSSGDTESPIYWRIEYQEGGINEWAVLTQKSTGQDIEVPYQLLGENTNIRALGTDLGGAGALTSINVGIELQKD